MAGIYLHIPFCRQACHYCDFHFSTSMNRKDEMLQAMQQELVMRKNELENEKIETIYVGGGTPSLLSADELKKLFDVLYAHYQVSNDAEITLESNPDDLSKEKIKALKTTAINRFSIGIQSFFAEDLQYMNRAHNAAQAEASIKASQDAGFENITIDLIYATPTLTDAHWEENLDKAVRFAVPHISSYALTIENDTPLFHLVKRKKLPGVDEEKLVKHFLMLDEKLGMAGFEHYEISNFALPGHRSRHNTAYWKGVPYLGIGPSAHSFNGKNTRKWNLSNNLKYLKNIADRAAWFESEELSEKDLYNEYIMTGIRLLEGVSMAELEQRFGVNTKEHFYKALHTISPVNYQLREERFLLTNEGKLISDHIASTLFL